MNHNDFILSPVADILKDATSASISIGAGIETYPLCDYVMQSVFLKMTGAQEQKMKCILWELATHDYEYRYNRFSKKPLGECSTYDEKKEIYKDLIEQIEKLTSEDFDVNTLNKNDILAKTKQSIDDIFLGSNLLIWAQKSFNDYLNIWNDISQNHFAANKNLFANVANLPNTVNKKSLIDIYKDHLYKHRNRTAHNTLSYQQNLPTLKTLDNVDYKYNNYFIYFAILILIDTVIVELYKQYLLSLEEI